MARRTAIAPMSSGLLLATPIEPRAEPPPEPWPLGVPEPLVPLDPLALVPLAVPLLEPIGWARCVPEPLTPLVPPEPSAVPGGSTATGTRAETERPAETVLMRTRAWSWAGKAGPPKLKGPPPMRPLIVTEPLGPVPISTLAGAVFLTRTLVMTSNPAPEIKKSMPYRHVRRRRMLPRGRKNEQ